MSSTAKKVKLVELFSGTKSMSDSFEAVGYDTLTFDNVEELKPDRCVDILTVKPKDIPAADVIWASPPCQTFSVASIGTHWTGGRQAYIPKTDASKTGLQLLEKTISLIAANKPRVWFIENPRGVMRKVIDDLFAKHGLTDYVRHTVTYCQYGDTRMKPTDIWTNSKTWTPKSACKNGAPCHVRAPRGAKTGTQGLANARERGRIPRDLCNEIVKSVATATQ